MASTRCTPNSATLSPPARLWSHKLRAVKSLQAPRLLRSCKQLTVLQSSEMLVNRVPAGTAQQQVRFRTLLLSACCMQYSLNARVTAWTMQCLVNLQGENSSFYGQCTSGHS